MKTDSPLAVTDADLDDLVRRLAAVRPQSPGRGPGWERGVDLTALDELLAAWDPESWRRAEARIAALPWIESEGLRLVHAPSAEPDAPTVVLLHGWPDSVLRFERLLPLLADVDVFVPALPGFPFALPSADAGGDAATDVATIADAVAASVRALGRTRWVVSGGDVGADVAEQLATRHPDAVAALHLTNVSPLHAVFANRSALGPEELAYLDRVALWSRTEGAYIAEQSSKPTTLAVGLSDSPAGLAAWLYEKIRAWSDTTPDRDTLLMWIGAYWFTNTIGSSFDTYANLVLPAPFVPTPTMLSTFAHDTKPAPLSFARRLVRILDHAEHDRGGHFAAWEEPELYAADLRRAIELGAEATREG